MTEQAENPPVARVVRLSDKEMIADIRSRARVSIAVWLRELSQTTFWHPFERLAMSAYYWLNFLGYGRRDKLDANSVVNILVRESPYEFHTFEATWSADGRYHPSLEITLNASAEWENAIAEAWEGLQRPPNGLSDPAQTLLVWARIAEHEKRWTNKSTIGKQAKLRGTSWTAEFLRVYLAEIQAKTSHGLKWEEKEDAFRISFEDVPEAEAVQTEEVGPLNPVLPVDVKKVDYTELKRFSDSLHDWIVNVELPDNRCTLVVWKFHDRATLHHCFPKWQEGRWEVSDVTEFLSEVAVQHGVLWGYSFKDPEPWEYYCVPKEGWDWKKVKASILDSRSAPPLTERYGISEESAAILHWFTSLQQTEWLGSMTPEIEEHLERRIGIAPDWDEENFGAYFGMLADELTEKTEWNVRVQKWKGRWQDDQHRLVVRKKLAQKDALVHQIQIMGFEHGKSLSKYQIERALANLTR